MTDNNEGIIQRINELIEESGLKKSRFAVEVGINASNFGKKLEGKLGFSNMDFKLISKKTNVRIGWLTTGEGQKFKAPEEFIEQAKRDSMPTRTYDAHTGVPFYNTQFELGFDLMDIDNRTNPDYMIDFQPYNKADCWCTSKGNSMHPTISGGDIIALKRIDDFHILMNNEIYGIITVNGLRTIKRVKDNGDTLTLIPDNKDGYDEQVIEKKDVMHVFQVLGCIKMF